MLRFLIYTVLIFTAGYLWGWLGGKHERPYQYAYGSSVMLYRSGNFPENYAQLTGGEILRYDLCDKEDVVPGFTYLGRGVIHSSDGVLQNFSDTLNFFERWK